MNTQALRRRIIAAAIIVTLVATIPLLLAGPHHAFAAGAKVVVLGSDLTAEQVDAMKRFLGVQAGVQTVSVTNAEERAYLGQYVPAEMIGQKAISSASVETLAAGSGISVQVSNITWVTPEMYASALVTAGVKDARVIAAAPLPVSGTAALTGILKAFESASGTGLPSSAKSVAANELYQTGQLGEQIGDKNKATRFIIMAKQQVSQAGTGDPTRIRAIITNVAKQNNITLTDAQIQQLTTLMTQIRSLNLSVSQLTTQLQNVRSQLDKVLGSLAQTRSWIQRLIDTIRNLIGRIAALFRAKTTAALRTLRIIK